MLFWILLAAPLLFLVISIFLGSIEPKYSNTTNEMSYLIYGRNGKWQTANFIGCGILTIGLAISLINTSSSTYNSIYLIQLCALVLGVSLIMLRIFPTQLKEHKTYVSSIHKLIFTISVIAQGIMQIAFALSNPNTLVATYLYMSGTIVLFGLPAMYIWKGFRGLSQRILVAAIMLWVTFGAILIHQ